MIEPCPFCDEELQPIKGQADTYRHPTNTGCWLSASVVFPEDIPKWNRRASPWVSVDREKLAAIQHDIWAHWMKYLFSVSGGGLISASNVERWTREMNTPYDQLTRKEQLSDLEQVDKFLPLLTPPEDE